MDARRPLAFTGYAVSVHHDYPDSGLGGYMLAAAAMVRALPWWWSRINPVRRCSVAMPRRE